MNLHRIYLSCKPANTFRRKLWNSWPSVRDPWCEFLSPWSCFLLVSSKNRNPYSLLEYRKIVPEMDQHFSGQILLISELKKRLTYKLFLKYIFNSYLNRSWSHSSRSAYGARLCRGANWTMTTWSLRFLLKVRYLTHDLKDSGVRRGIVYCNLRSFFGTRRSFVDV